jgi:hypothetical protein
MNAFIRQHAQAVIGMVQGWDRLRFRGTLRMLANVVGMDRFLGYGGHLLKDFKQYAQTVSRRVREQSLAVAEAAGRPVEHLNSPKINKEQRAAAIAQRDGITEGLVAVLTATESCSTYDIASHQGRLVLRAEPGKCQHLYHYYLHPVFGPLYVRLQTWFPFTIYLGLNGRDWLARQLDAAGIPYRKHDNCFSQIADPEAAQRLLEQQVSYPWAQKLGELGRQVNPALPGIVGGYRIDYYWSLEQSEWASDVLFGSAAELDRLFPSLARHALESFRSPQVMRFLGRSVARGIAPRFAGEVISDLVRRPEGMRVKHAVNRNSVKMYNKAGSILRVETTLNDMRDLRAPRMVNGQLRWERMRKGVGDIARRAEVSAASNRRYLEALAAVATPVPLKTLTDGLSRPVTWQGRRERGLNLLGEDAALLLGIGGGEFLLNGFRNRDVQGARFGPAAGDAAEARRRSGQVTRKLRLLRAHGLIHKVPHTHRYLVSDKGRQLIAALHAAREADIQKLTHAA